MNTNGIQAEDRLGPSVVDDVRAVREAIDREAGHDIDLLAAQARQIGEEYRHKRGAKAATVPGPPSLPPARVA
jgi:hypothetical protein